jgi:undecaprenyl-diphosphatase
MIEYLESIDRAIVLAINSLHSPLLDEIMWTISGRAIWFPFYAWLLFLVYNAFGFKKMVLFLLLAVATIAVADLVSVHALKNVVERYRPSHHALLKDQLHFYTFENGDQYKGGQFGFVSSHAANFFAIASISFFVLRQRYAWLWKVLLVAVLLVCFSRIYLGVHYLTDVIGGAILGIGSGFLFWKTLWRGSTPIK